MTTDSEYREVPADHVVVGMDVGQQQDPSALVVVRPVEETTGKWHHNGHEEGAGTGCEEWCAPEWRTRHDVSDTLTLPLGLPYPAQVGKVRTVASQLLEQIDIKTVHLVIDATGVGRPLLDALREAELPDVVVTPVVIGPGGADRIEGGLGSWRVSASAACLMTRLQSKVLGDRLRIADTERNRRLLDEARTFQFEVMANGALRFGNPGGTHDDLVYALALATLFDGTRGFTIGRDLWADLPDVVWG